MIRKSIDFLTLLMFPFFLSSCETEETGTKTPAGEDGDQVKELAVSIFTSDDIYRPSWEKGESIVVNGQVSEPLQNTPSGRATFTFEQPLTSPYAIVSPVEAYKGEGSIFLPSDQSYVVCTSYGWYFPTLKPITGALKIPTTGNMSQAYLKDEPAKVRVKGNAGEQLHGTFSYDMKLGLFSSASDAASDKVMEVDIESDEVIVYMPAGNYAEGVTVTFIDKSGNTYDFVLPGPVKIKPGIYTDTPEFLSGALENGESKTEVVQVRSNSMDKNVPVTVITPKTYLAGSEFPVVYLLHGYSDNYQSWSKDGHIEALANKHNVIVVMPDGGYSSWYFDSPLNPTYRYETFVSSELITYIDKNYKTIPRRTARAITGNSMGGHGALYLTIRHQNVFGIVGSLSGGVDIRPFSGNWEIAKRLGAKNQYPENWEANTVINLTGQIKPDNLDIIIHCGTSDFFYDVNCNLHDKLNSEGIKHEFHTHAGEGHSWSYWFNVVRDQFQFFSTKFR